MPTDYGTVAITGDTWINERAQEILTRGLPPLPVMPDELRCEALDAPDGQADNAEQQEE